MIPFLIKVVNRLPLITRLSSVSADPRFPGGTARAVVGWRYAPYHHHLRPASRLGKLTRSTPYRHDMTPGQSLGSSEIPDVYYHECRRRWTHNQSSTDTVISCLPPYDPGGHWYQSVRRPSAIDDTSEEQKERPADIL